MRTVSDAAPPAGSPASGWHPLVAIAGALAAVAVAMLIGHRLTTVLPAAYVVSIFLVAVLTAAALFGPWSGLVAAVASFFAFNFFFVEPTFTFAVDDPREVFALGIFLVAAILTGGLAGRLRETADAARRRADTLAMLQDFAQRVSATTDLDEIRALIARHVSDGIGGRAVLIDRRPLPDPIGEAWPEPVASTAEEIAAIEAVFATEPPRAVATERFVFRPLTTAEGVVAVIGLDRATAPGAGSDRGVGVDALIEQAAVALERARFAEDRAEARATAERERLRSALLSSISHDLRTPLATILGSVTSLRQLGDRMTPDDRADLLAAIEEETDRLSRFVADLLLMTRLEAGLDVRRDSIDAGDVVAAAAERLRRVHPDHPVRLARSAAPAPVRGDATLLEHVLVNLGDNAAKASAKGAPIDVSVCASEGRVEIAVTDRGRGLTADEIRRLFDHGEARGGASGGHGGLGVAIARRVVAAMGGTTTAESRTARVPGTRVTLVLPEDVAAPPVEAEGDEP